MAGCSRGPKWHWKPTARTWKRRSNTEWLQLWNAKKKNGDALNATKKNGDRSWIILEFNFRVPFELHKRPRAVQKKTNGILICRWSTKIEKNLQLRWFCVNFQKICFYSNKPGWIVFRFFRKMRSTIIVSCKKIWKVYSFFKNDENPGHLGEFWWFYSFTTWGKT